MPRMTATGLRLLSAVSFAFVALAPDLGAERISVQRVPFELAVTFDDLPWSSAQSSAHDTVAAGTTQILSALRSRRVVATGFIVCDAMTAQPGQVERWLEAGHSLGNHTQHHGNVDTIPVADWLGDVQKCDEAIRHTGAEPRYFRFPYLRHGTGALTRTAATRGVGSLGYVIAPVTIDNSEWILASAYEDAARARNAPRAERIGRMYVDHIRRAARHARDISRALFDREVKQILLLHANRLNADWLGALLDSLSADGAKFISLDAARADPIYALEDGYMGSRGLSWLYRIAPARPDLAEWDDVEAATLRTELEQYTERK